jgi:hypothetical protein
MSYEIIFFYDGRVAVLNTTSYQLLPFVYSTLSEFMLFTVLNNNQIITDKDEYIKAYAVYEEFHNFNDECDEAVDLIKTYDCEEISIIKIKDALPSLGETIDYGSSILNNLFN